MPGQPKSLASYVRESHERKEVKTMKYETPELTVLAPVITAVQTNSQGTKIGGTGEGTHPTVNDDTAAYADWE